MFKPPSTPVGDPGPESHKHRARGLARRGGVFVAAGAMTAAAFAIAAPAGASPTDVSGSALRAVSAVSDSSGTATQKTASGATNLSGSALSAKKRLVCQRRRRRRGFADSRGCVVKEVH